MVSPCLVSPCMVSPCLVSPCLVRVAGRTDQGPPATRTAA